MLTSDGFNSPRNHLGRDHLLKSFIRFRQFFGRLALLAPMEKARPSQPFGVQVIGHAQQLRLLFDYDLDFAFRPPTTIANSDWDKFDHGIAPLLGRKAGTVGPAIKRRV
ncbi:MAG TPA: hypothetical protein VJ302_21060 [Blastocatellia bacterium]|nr:hypothetical protein [Blastocatellia bacterium]